MFRSLCYFTGIDTRRIKFSWVSAAEGAKWADIVNTTVASIRELGPYGNIFPIDDRKGKNLLFIAGGIALPPMRCVNWNALDLGENFKDVTIPVLAKLGFTDENIYTTLENRMKCGFGKCGRCNVGKVYVCKDGPVFTLAQLKELPDEY